MVPIEKHRCTGCGACAQVCPAQCIVMEPDSLGFLYPAVEDLLCTGCNRCSRVCPAEAPPLRRHPSEQYAAWHRDKDVLMHSSSGGVFTALTEALMAQGALVCGAIYGDGMKNVQTTLSGDKSVILAMSGSKYVQSDKKDVYRQIQSALTNGQAVLFSGTPCEAAGLTGFLGKEYDKLYLCDFICNGVGSPRHFEKHIAWLKHKMGGEVTAFTFRSKALGPRYIIEARFKNKKRYLRPMAEDAYGRAYASALLLRESCYHCPYADARRVSDITFGDFWGYQSGAPARDSKGGVSAVMVNTEKGKGLFRLASDHMVTAPCGLEQITQHNSRLAGPAKRPSGEDQCETDFKVMKYEEFTRKWLTDPWLKALLKKTPLYHKIRIWLTSEPAGRKQ